MVSISNLSVLFGSSILFKDISFLINKSDRIGLVGKNGAGKSTLLKIIAGGVEPSSGNVSYPTDFSYGYLPQELSFNDGNTVYEEARLAFEEILKVQQEIDKINEEISHRTDYESEEYLQLLNDLHDLNTRHSLIDAHSIDGEIEKVLFGLGFVREDFNRPTSEFSGGWRMRIELAKILLKDNDLLLLDEPTNHLDIESIQWIENFIKNYQGAVLLISHDKALLDNVTNRTVEISLGKIYDYAAPYTKYLGLREEQRTLQRAAYENQQKQIKDTEAFINRFRAKASKATQVQSKVKQLNKIDRIEIEAEDNSEMRFRFPPSPRSGKVVFQAENVRKNYDDYEVFSKVDFDLERGEKIALVGKNGAGKTTFSKIIVGEETCAGMAKLGHEVKIGYYAQNQSDILDKSKTVFETIDDEAVGEIRKKVRNILGSFLFSGEDQDKKVSVLSGGEKARLAFCKLLLEPVNFLVLDEPTNHLDIKSKNVLKKTLQDYDGSMVIISHDRDFLDGLVNKVYEFTDHTVKQHIGGIYDFLKKKNIENIAELQIEKKVQENNNKKSGTSGDSFKLKKETDKQIRQLNNKISRLEESIAGSEQKIAKLNQSLADPKEFSQELLSQLEKSNEELENLMQEWESAQKSFEQLEKKRSELQF